MNTRHHKRRHIIKNLLILVVAVGLFVSGIGAVWVATLKMPDLQAFETRVVTQSTKIYDRTGQVLLYDIHDNAKRTVVPLASISPYIKNATVAIEDDAFYTHHGVRLKSLFRAVWANITAGGYSQGGSTITQQVVKNSLLTQDKTITRKLKEWVLAIKLENVMSKEQILETYLNENPYGGSVYGVEEASKTFFGKSAKDVTLAEAAFIAALPQAPTYYSPYGSHQDKLLQRKNLVLQKMLENKYITEDQYKAALAERVRFENQSEVGLKAPHFAFMVKEYLVDKYGEDFVEQGGLKVITSLDYNIQKKAENDVANFLPTMKQNFGDALNIGLVAVDPKSGDILAMIGSRDYFDKAIDGNYNVALAKRQPGSSFKPFVYASAFNEGYTPETVLFDVKTEFSSSCTPDSKPKNPNATDTKCYSPDEYDHLFPGPMTMRRALAQSRNIPAVKTLYLTGIKSALSVAQDLGVEGLTDPNRYGLTLVLGGGEVSLLNMTSAYSVFANDGVRNPSRSVLEIDDSKGNIIEKAENRPTEVLPPNTARDISDILTDQSVRLESLVGLLSAAPRDIAIKTGTTNDTRDVWTIGFTPQIALGMWAGHNDNTPIKKENSTAGLIIAPLWSSVMLDITKDMPVEYFKKPEPTPDDLKPVLRGHWQGSISYTVDKSSGAVATDATPPELRQEIIANNVHTILYWLNKDDPRGPIPAHPENDSQFANWEYSVRKWYDAWKLTNPDFNETTNVVIPTATDNTHANNQAPLVSFTSPSGTYSKKNRVTAQITATSQSGKAISKAEYYINGKYVGTAYQDPFSFSFIPEDIDGIKELNQLKVIVYDAILNKGEATTQFGVVK